MTIKEVAQLAGVSSAAVSRYINGGSLSEEKKERVRRAIEETGYRPNLMARTMRTGHGGQIGVIVPKIHSDSVSRVTAGITLRLSQENYMTVLGNTEEDAMHQIRYLELMENNQVEGIILMGSVLKPEILEAIRACRVPLVVTGQKVEGVSCIYHDDFHAARDLAALMIRRGRRRFAYVGATEEDPAVGLHRRMGVQAALQEAGLDPAAMPRTISRFHVEDGCEKMKELLSSGAEFDAVIGATDRIALGAMMALKEKGFKIPEDVSVAGIGDCWADIICCPAMSTVRLDYPSCGRMAADLLLRLIRGEEAGEGQGPRQVMLPYTLVDRESIGPAFVKF
jgi:LacI family sucrose operon transcriptional repressor